MKAFLLFAIAFAMSLTSHAQSSWTITHNGQQKLKTDTEGENVIALSQKDLKKKGSLCVTYKAEKPPKGWKRYYALVDATDAELVRQSGNALEVSNAKLARLTAKTKALQIYTWALPTDPAVAATVRVRRIHLGTLQISE